MLPKEILVAIYSIDGISVWMAPHELMVPTFAPIDPETPRFGKELIPALAEPHGFLRD
jgi:hypothetical protein